MECVRCLVASQSGEYLEEYPKMIHFDFGEVAAVVYGGQSLCLSHFNLDRGHDPQLGNHLTPGNKRYKERVGII